MIIILIITIINIHLKNNKKLLNILELNPDIILSHQPISNIDFSEHKVKYYISGHCKIDPFIQIKDDLALINVDNKILILE
jgi:predicted MPP superfamily phosphohydrolase